MKTNSFAIVVCLIFFTNSLDAQTTVPSTQPFSRPVKVSIDLDNVTAAEAVAKLSAVTALPMKWQSGRTGKRFSLHEKDRPLLDVIADLCAQGSCIPRNNYGPGEMFFTAAQNPPIAVYRPTEMSLLLLNSIHVQERIDVKNGNAKSHNCNLQMTLIFDPAAQVASVRGLNIDRVLAEDNTEFHNNNDSWYEPQLRFDAIAAWEVQTNVNVQASLGKKMSVFGVIRAYTLQDFTQLYIDDPTTADKTFGNDELKCTVGKPSDGASVTLKLEGKLVDAYGAERMQQLFSGGTVTALDQNDQPLTPRVDVNWQGSSVQLVLRAANRASWKEAGPASITIRIPRAARQIEIPVEMRDLTIR